MAERPSYQQLEQRVLELERAVIERKNFAQTLRESEAKTRAILETIPDLMFRLSAQGEHLNFYAPGVDQLFISPEKFLQKRVDEVLPKDVSDQYMHHIKMALDTGQLQVFEYQLNFPEGIRYYESRMVASGKNETLVFVRNITNRKQAEEALWESEERFRNTFEQAAVGIAHISPNGRFIRINKRFCNILGYSPEELLNLTLQKITCKEDLEKDLDYGSQVLEGKIKTYSMEKRYLKKDDSLVWVNTTVSLVRDPSGNPKYFISVVEDITERRQSADALKTSEERYRNLFENTGTATFVAEEDMTVSEVNTKCEKLSGYSSDEISGKMKVTDFIPAEYQDRIKKYHLGRRERDEKVPTEYELVLTNKKGELKNILIQVGLVPGTKQSVASVIDITSLKQAEASLRESEDRYKSLFKNNHSIMILIDPESADIVDANPAATKYYGYSLEEITAKKITDINTLTEEQVRMEMERAKKEQRQQFFFRHRLANGDIRDVEVFSGPIELHGKQLLYSIVHDISDRIRAERERTKLIQKLRESLSEVKTLRGFLPICASCKKIRDDKGYWNQIESYIQARSEAEFSHSICPDCAEVLYPDFDFKA